MGSNSSHFDELVEKNNKKFIDSTNEEIKNIRKLIDDNWEVGYVSVPKNISTATLVIRNLPIGYDENGERMFVLNKEKFLEHLEDVHKQREYEEKLRVWKMSQDLNEFIKSAFKPRE